ncbi:MAG TPA: PEP-CTERM sorting domain-containing protein [Fimbriimonadaceae bacterium]|nr:PEP-CTERM sorting domain-containing protein [Fimbriimonadaceae bacterium]
MFGSKVFGIAALSGLCVLAGAGTMTFNGMDSLSESITIGGAHYNGSVNAGLMDFTESSLGDIRTFCVDLDHVISNGQTWPDTLWDSSTYPMAGIELAGNLVDADFANVTTADEAVGLQVDIWKARYDGPAGSTPDFTTGNFTASGLTSGALAAANTYWQDRNTVGSAVYIRSEDGAGQDQMTVNPVPEPASIGALVIGALTLLRRSRKAR